MGFNCLKARATSGRQFEVQGYHWNKQQCTLYPVVLYHKNEKNELQWIAICFVSDDLDQSKERKICNYIKDKLPSVRKVEYFIDGCAGQYKNVKNFINLCHHKIDLNIDASWSFFATSHGKSPCDGIGDTVKCKITRASLQRPLSNQILSFSAVEELCSSITRINFFFHKQYLENIGG